MTLGQRIKTLREKRGWTQNELARQADMNQPTVNKIELDSRTPSVTLAKQIADALGVTVDDLLGGREPKPKGPALVIKPKLGKAATLAQHAAEELARAQIIPSVEELSDRVEILESETAQILPLVERVQTVNDVLLLLVDSVVLKPAQKRSIRERLAQAGGDRS